MTPSSTHLGKKRSFRLHSRQTFEFKGSGSEKLETAGYRVSKHNKHGSMDSRVDPIG